MFVSNILIAEVIGLLIVAVLAGLAGRYYVVTFVNQRRAKELADLNFYRARLGKVVSELLASANDLDQAMKYLPKENTHVSEEVGRVCQELVRLGEALPLIDQLVESENLRDGKDGILRTCRMATKISAELQQLREQEPKLIVDKKHPEKPA